MLTADEQNFKLDTGSGEAVCAACSRPAQSVPSPYPGMVTSDCRSYIPITWQFVCCNECGFIWVDRDSTKQVEDFYSQDYAFHKGAKDNLEFFRFDSNIASGVADYLANLMVNYIVPDPSFSYLDIGAGKGTMVNAVHQRFPEIAISALEPSPAFETLANRPFLKKAVHGFFEPASFPETQFNLVSIIDVLEHVPEPYDFLLQIRDVLADDGYLFIEVPNFANNDFDVITYDHLGKFTLDSLLNLVEAAGYKVIEQWVPQTVAMQIIVQKTEVPALPNPSRKIDAEAVLQKAIDACNWFLTQAHLAASSHHQLALYGQGIIGPYLMGAKLLEPDQIKVLVDDNPLYQGETWLSKTPIISMDTFKKDHADIPLVLTMNRCYHPRVKTQVDGLNVYGWVDESV